MTDILSATADTNTNTTENGYEPRRSTRIKKDYTTAGDGDIWHEHLVVCEADDNKLVIRSYFKNSRTKKKVWDEPPTGASHIEPASATKRTEAENELKTLQVAMDVNGNHDPAATIPSSAEADDSKKSKKGRGFFSAFRKKTKDTKNGSASAKSSSGKSGGRFHKSNKKGTNKNAAAKDSEDMDGDEDMQRAIGLSMGLQHDPVASSQQTTFKTFSNNQWQEDMEALEMAKAISMSEAEAGGAVAPHAAPMMMNTNTNMNSDDEMLQRAIEESRRTTNGVAALPSREADLLGFTEYDSKPTQHPHQASSFPGMTEYGNNSSNSFLDQKMPAKANLKKPPSPPAASLPTVNPTTTSFAAMSFDTYAQGPPAAAAVAVPASYDAQNSSPNGLRKMDDNEDRKPAAGLGRLMYNKKTVEDEAGVV